MTMKNVVTKVEKELTFDLTVEERAKMADEAGAAEEEARALEAELSQYTSDKKAKIAGLYEKSSELLKLIRRRKEERVVDCDEVRDYEKAEVRWMWKGKEMEARPMTEQEKQVKLDLDEKKRKRHQQNLAKVQDALKGGEAPKKKKTKQEQEKQDLQDVIRAETNSKTKTDMVTQ